MVEAAPLKGLGTVLPFAAIDVALLGGLRRMAGDLTFQDPNANGGSPVTLSQVLAAIGVSSWVDLSDTIGPLVANSLVAGNPAGDKLIFPGETISNVRATMPATTGVTTPGELELTLFDPTRVAVSAGDMRIAVRNNSENVTEKLSNLAVGVTITPTGLANSSTWWTAADPGLTGTVTIKQYSAQPTVAELREETLLGVSLHKDSLIIAVISAPDVWRDAGQAVTDIWRQLTSTSVKRGTGVPSEIPATLTVAVTDMVLLGLGLGFHSSAGVTPNESPTIPGSSPIVFDTIDGDGARFDEAISVFPTTWNDGGVETALTGNKAVVHQLVRLANGDSFVQLGTTDYANFDAAVESINNELLQNPLWQPARLLGVELGVAVVANNVAGAWADGLAHFYALSTTGVIGGQASTWLNLQDTPAAPFPTRGHVPLTDATAQALRFGKPNAQALVYLEQQVAANGVGPVIPVHAFRFNITRVYLRSKIAPAADLIVDVNLNGSTIFSGAKPTILAAANSGSQVPTTVLAVQGQEFTIDLDQSDAVWDGLTVAIEGWVEFE